MQSGREVRHGVGDIKRQRDLLVCLAGAGLAGDRMVLHYGGAGGHSAVGFCQSPVGRALPLPEQSGLRALTCDLRNYRPGASPHLQLPWLRTNIDIEESLLRPRGAEGTVAPTAPEHRRRMTRVHNATYAARGAFLAFAQVTMRTSSGPILLGVFLLPM